MYVCTCEQKRASRNVPSCPAARQDVVRDVFRRAVVSPLSPRRASILDSSGRVLLDEVRLLEAFLFYVCVRVSARQASFARDRVQNHGREAPRWPFN